MQQGITRRQFAIGGFASIGLFGAKGIGSVPLRVVVVDVDEEPSPPLPGAAVLLILAVEDHVDRLLRIARRASIPTVAVVATTEPSAARRVSAAVDAAVAFPPDPGVDDPSPWWAPVAATW